MELHLEKLSSVELKTLLKAAEEERKRRARRSPDNHEPPKWPVPVKAVNGSDGG